MIIKETPYVDDNGNSHYDIIKWYSDLGCSLVQTNTNVRFGPVVLDSVNSRYNYIEDTAELGEIFNSTNRKERLLFVLNGNEAYSRNNK